MTHPGATTTTSARDQLLGGVRLEERVRSLAGVSTTLLEGGDGPTMVLLHGPGESALSWLPVLERLARRHRLVVPDLPGHGESALPAEGLTDAWLSTWLDELVSATCADRPVLVGRVIGGGIAASYAAKHPGRLAHLVLVDTTGLTEFAPDPRFELAMHRYLAAPDRVTFERFMDLCAFDLDSARARLGSRWEPFEQYALELAVRPETQSAMGALIGIYAAQALPAEVLRAITTPCTLIWGRHDAATILRVAEEASTRFGWALRVIDGAGDDPQFDRPDEFVEVLYDVLQVQTALPRPSSADR